MKHITIHTYLYKITSYLLVTLTILGGMITCSGSEEPAHGPGKETQVSLVLNTGKYITRAGITNETDFNKLHAIVLEKESGTYRCQYLTTPSPGEGTNQYNIRLYTTTNAIKVLLIGNVDNTADLIKQAETEEEIKEVLLLTFDGEEAAYLPMYGELIYENGISEDKTYNPSVTMLRAVAAVDVSPEKALFDGGTFILKTIQAYRANNLIQVIPDGIDGFEWKVDTPSVPAEVNNNITTPFVNAEAATEETPVRIYLPEAEEPANITSQATCLIVGGIYRGSGYESNQTVTYYRIDFKNANQIPTGQILRNHLYSITISAVTGPGTTHPEDSDTTGIEVKMYDWSDPGLPPIEL